MKSSSLKLGLAAVGLAAAVISIEVTGLGRHSSRPATQSGRPVDLGPIQRRIGEDASIIARPRTRRDDPAADNIAARAKGVRPRGRRTSGKIPPSDQRARDVETARDAFNQLATPPLD